MAEAGYPDFKVDSYFFALAPAGVPQAVAAVLERQITQVLKAPDLQDKLRAQELEVVAESAAAARERLQADTALWARIVKTARMQVD